MARLSRSIRPAVIFSIALLIPTSPYVRETESVSRSVDVKWLEDLATSEGPQSGAPASPAMGRHSKDVRTSAYARLGELATTDSLAAVHRIEVKAKTRWRKRSIYFTQWTHPSWHFSDFDDDQKVAVLNVSGGLAYTIVRDRGLLGDDDFYVLQAPSPRWQEWYGPWLIPMPASPTFRTMNLVFTQGSGVLIAFTTAQDAMLELRRPPSPDGPPPKVTLLQTTHLVTLKETQQDADGDGWTDWEEERLGLDPHNMDSDGDGTPDWLDGCPDFAPGPEDWRDESLQILQKAIFATLGLSGSRDLILATPESPKLQVWGYRGPILYRVNRKEWGEKHAGGLWVTWRIDLRKEDEAVVGITDYAGMLASGGQSVFLRRIAGEWYVVKRETGPIS